MAGNLVSQILQSITPEIVSRIAQALGLKSSDVQEALAGSIPAVLAALVGVVSKTDGGRRLTDAISQSGGTSALNTLGTGNVQSVADKGLGVLTSALGGSSLSTLATAIGKFSGLGEGAASTLIGLAAPVVMNGIRNEAGGLDASKITNLLLSQKGTIASALPSGLGSLLGGSEVLSGLRSAGSAASQASRSVPATGSNLDWLKWAVPLILIAGGLWYFIGHKASPPPTPPAETTTPAPPAATTADPTAQATAAIDSLKAQLQGITDSSSAKAALPKLQEVDGQLASLSNLVTNLSADQKKALAAVVVAALPTLNQLFDKILAIPGVGDIAKPVIDGLRTKLDTLSKQ